jgi:hypothetical protein
MDTTSHGTPILHAKRSQTHADEYEALVIRADTYIFRPTRMSRENLISFLDAQIFAYQSREKFLTELDRKGVTNALVVVTENGDSD